MFHWPLAFAALALFGYAVASHWLMVHAGQEPWAVAALLAPMLGLAAWLALRLRNAPALLACGVAAAVLATLVSRGGLGSVDRLYVLQHVALHVALGCGFAFTLRNGATPLISAMAARAQGPLDDGVSRYTRRLTAIWVAYFFGMAVLSVMLFVLAPWWWWSLYANVLTPLAAGTLFVGEYLLRYRLHPEFRRVSLVQTFLAYRQTPMSTPRGR
jgi:uncharacterized membrane protein